MRRRLGVKTLSPDFTGPYDPFDLAALAARGCRFVLCGHGKRPLGPWATPPPFGAVLGHVARGDGLLGWRPDSLALTVLDVDSGPWQDLADWLGKWPPFTALVTPRGAHMAYQDTAPRGNAKWAARGLAGDVRGAAGYCVLWPGGERRLANSFDYPRWGAVPAQQLIHDLSLPLFDVSAHTEGAPASVPDRPAEGWRYAPATSTMAARHDRHNALCENMLVALGRSASMRGQLGAILSMSRRYNAALPEPLPDAEIVRVSRYFAKYSADWEYRPHTAQFLARQQRKGFASGVARREATAERNAAIRAARAEGVTLADLAKLYGLAPRHIRRIAPRT